MFLQVLENTSVELNWQIIGFAISIILNILMAFFAFFVKTQRDKDEVQDDEVTKLKTRVDQLEGKIDNKLDKIMQSLSEVSSTIRVSTERTANIFSKIKDHTAKIEKIQQEINEIKERIIKLESHD